MKRRNFLIFLILTIALSLGVTGFAQHGANQPHPGHGGGSMHPHDPVGIFRDLDLTLEQRNKVHTILSSQGSVTKSLMDSNFANHEKLQNLIKAGNFDLAQVKAIAGDQANNHLALIVERQRSHSQIYAILTPEQQAKLDQTQPKFAERKPNPPDQERLVEMFSKRLSLSTDQENQVRTIFTSQKEAVFPLLERLGEFHKQLANITTKGQFDETQIKNIAKEYLPTMVDLEVAHTTIAFNVYSLLNDEQRQEFLRFPLFAGPGGPGPRSGRAPR